MSIAHSTPWHAHLPAPKAQPRSITPADLKALQEASKVAGVDYVVVDVRRTDIDVSP
jgi:hypothetical protein